MSAIDLGLLLNGIDRRAGHPAGSADPAAAPLRVVLVQGETLRLPAAYTRVNVLTGAAWITQGGEDNVVMAGCGLSSAAGSDGAVVSALGTVPLLLEVR